MTFFLLPFKGTERDIKTTSPRLGILWERKAQSAVWGLLTILVLVAIAGGLVDIYRIPRARLERGHQWWQDPAELHNCQK
jgi:hypothetical protein